jgi:chromosome segregation ATPase
MSNTITIDQETQQAHAAIDAAAAKRKDHELQLGRLQKQVDADTGALLTAESRRNSFAQRIKELIATAEGLWSQTTGARGISPVHSLVEAYGNIAALENACADFARIKKQLVANVEQSKAQLADFQRRNPK